MDAIGDEQVLQAFNGILEGGGVDNDALDLIAEFMSAQDSNSLLFPDDLISSSINHNTAHHKVAPPDYHNIHHQNNDGDIIDRGSHGMQFRNQAFISPSLPDSPPDSSSEPYSPPSDCSTKSDSVLMNGNLPSVVTSINNGFVENYSPVQQNHMMTELANQSFDASLTLPPGYGSEMFPLQQTPSPHTTPSPMRISPNPGQMSQNRRSKMKAPQPGQQTQPQINTQMMPGGSTYSSAGSLNNSQHQHKKRKHSISPKSSVNPALLNVNVQHLAGILKKEPIKREPGTYPSCAEEAMTLHEMLDLEGVMETNCVLIKFQFYQQMKYMTVLDGNLSELPPPVYHVSADKGFNFSTIDDSFVCQKKNHFQVTASIQVSGDPQFVRTPDGCMKVDKFYVHFHGIKGNSPTSKIKVEQSQADRSKKPFHPVQVDLPADQVTKVTVGRLHFSETTLNNMRKKGKPNPDQRYFMLVVELRAHCGGTNHLISSMVSEKIIVRASNPGQFESDAEYTWQKGQYGDVVFHEGRVGINTDSPEEALTIHGNIKLTGQLMQPSDMRAKENITEMDSKEQLEHVQRMKIYKYLYNKDYAEQAGLSEDELEDTGVLAQELREVLPDAVTETGDVILSNGNTIEKFLVVNKDRIYMENVGAVKELCKLTDNLENRIDELERVNKKLTKLKRFDSSKSCGSGKSFSSSTTAGSRYLPPKDSGKGRSLSKPPTPPQDDGICSNRFIQVAIIILVLVMAFCLIAMVTLYILEKKEDTGSAALLSGTSEPVIIGTLSTNLPTSPPTISSTGHHESAKVPTGTTSASSTKAPIEPASVTENATTTSSPTTTPTVATTAQPIPEKLTPKRCLTHECEELCCRKIGNSEGEFPIYGPTDFTKKNASAHIPEPEYDVHVNYDQTRKAARRKHPSNGQPPPVKPRRRNLADKIGEPNQDNNMNNTVPNAIFRRKRRRRGVKDGEYDIKTIVIKGTEWWDDFIVDRTFCKDKCNQGNNSYLIRVSQFIPVQSLSLEFTTPLSLMITFCGHGTGKQVDCSETVPAPSVEESATSGPTHKWNLPIGYAFHIWFKFRVGDKNSQGNICLNPASELGVTYTEYTFEFLRDRCTS